MPAASVSDRARTRPSREARPAPWIGKGSELKDTQADVQGVAQQPVMGPYPAGALRRATSPTAGEDVAREDGYIIALQHGDAVPHELWVNGRRLAAPPLGEGTKGELTVGPPAADPGRPPDTLKFYVPRTLAPVLAGESDFDHFEGAHVPSEDAVFDAVVARFGTCLISALEGTQRASGVFVEYVTWALGAYIAHTYGRARIEPRPIRGGLTPWQERRTKQMLSEDLSGKVTLARLASECGLSVSHFARAFKQTTGHPPHRWLVVQRIEQAKKLLLTSALPLADIALECGFADQSHFTRVFSQTVGTGPGAWRRARSIDPAGPASPCAHDARSERV
jgi:AraC family transcriptional regulator